MISARKPLVNLPEYAIMGVREGVERMLNKGLYTILLVIAVNLVLFLAHVFAIFGLAFNDSSAEFPSVDHLLPNLFFLCGPVGGRLLFLNSFFGEEDRLL